MRRTQIEKATRPVMDWLLQPRQAFLNCATPKEWIAKAKKPENLPVLLIYHANCELTGIGAQLS